MEEEENFERVLTIPQREMPGIDKNHEAWTLAAKGREMFNRPAGWERCGSSPDNDVGVKLRKKHYLTLELA
jgi:hypothetical protein